jgi:hypothetical protein
MIEDAWRRRVPCRCDMRTRLLVEPPFGEAELISDDAGLFQHNTVRLEDRIDVTGCSSGVIGQCMAAPPKT